MRSSRIRFGALVVLAACLFLAAALVAPEIERDADSSPRFAVEGLLDRLGEADVSSFRVRSGGETLTFEQSRPGRWEIVERSGYPADAAAIREAIFQIAELRLLERKTSNPERFRGA